MRVVLRDWLPGEEECEDDEAPEEESDEEGDRGERGDNGDGEERSVEEIEREFFLGCGPAEGWPPLPSGEGGWRAAGGGVPESAPESAAVAVLSDDEVEAVPADESLPAAAMRSLNSFSTCSMEAPRASK